ncbi:ATP-binding protein [Myxococcota bacterium]|jgi:energy-coupling factor transporter ATP-binding protein EcfA2|nr:ATP-binding protein [Myxococcota bacterium]
MTPTPWTLRATDFRAHRELQWHPEPGVNVLVGPNGSGKTSVFKAMTLLSATFSREPSEALRRISPRNLLNLRAPPDGHVKLSVEVGEAQWTLRLPVNTLGLRGSVGEELRHRDQIVLRAAMFQSEWFLGQEPRQRGADETRCSARILWDEQRPEWMRPLVEWLRGLRVYRDWWLKHLFLPIDRSDITTRLDEDGLRLWSVLSNWSQSRSTQAQARWVIEQARLAFPNQLSDMDFFPEVLAFRPGYSAPEQGLAPSVLSDGLLTALLQLTAIAGAKEGSTLAIDEMENQLHPFAIRVILEAMREEAARKGLTILLTTHSPEVLNEFKGEEERVFVLGEPGRAQPVPLSELVHEDELPIAYIGERYLRERFASQSEQARSSR